jgi:hypothetical protein
VSRKVSLVSNVEKVFVLETTAQDYGYGEKLRRKTTAKCNGLPPLASVGVLIKFVVRWLTDILDVLHHDDCPAGDPPYPNGPQTPAMTLERVIKGIIVVRCLKVRARKSSCKK